MSCDLFDIRCHLQGAVWEWWAGVGLLNKALIVGGLVLIVLGATRTLGSLLKRIGGWPAVIGGILAIIGLVLALMPRRPDEVDPAPPAKPPSKSKPAFQFGVDRKKAKPKRKTLQDLLSDRLRR